jgi:F-type H+-transporting ATPase subunit a
MEGIEVSGAQTLFEIGPIAITETILSLIIVTAILMVAGILLGRNLQKRPGKLQVLTEKGVSMLMNLVRDTMGEHNMSWVPYIGTIFLSSILGSLIGLTGFLRSTTADLAVVLTWAVMTSVIIWYQSIKRNGFLGWLKGFTEPIVVLLPLNILGEVASPLSLAFRHYGNILSGSVIAVLLAAAFTGVSNMLLGWLPGVLGDFPLFRIGIPAVLSLYFDIFSGCMQAFIFAMLTMLNVAGAFAQEDYEARRAKKLAKKQAKSAQTAKAE